MSNFAWLNSCINSYSFPFNPLTFHVASLLNFMIFTPLFFHQPFVLLFLSLLPISHIVVIIFPSSTLTSFSFLDFLPPPLSFLVFELYGPVSVSVHQWLVFLCILCSFLCRHFPYFLPNLSLFTHIILSNNLLKIPTQQQVPTTAAALRNWPRAPAITYGYILI